jgi:hypothetical protein
LDAPRSADAFHALLERAGDTRFGEHQARLERWMAARGTDQALWLGVMEGLGYAANRESMLTLAQRLPWAALRAGGLDQSAEARDAWLRDILLRAAGLHGTASPLPTAAGLEWRTVGVRPANHPRPRLLGAAALATRWVASGPMEYLLGALQEDGNRGILAALEVSPAEGPALIGRGRALAIVANTVLPGLAALAQAREDVALLRLVDERWRALPASGDNALTREALARLAPDWRARVNTARREQGLVSLALRLAGSTEPAALTLR